MRRAGVVGRAHGLDGSFYVAQPEAQLLAVGTPLSVDGVAATVVRRAGLDARPIVRLSICGDREAAEALRGHELLAVDGQPEPLGADEYRAEDLAGARVVDGERELGVVIGLVALPSCECLSVSRPAGGGELLVPLVHDAIRAIDLAAGVIEVDAAFLGEAEAAP